MNPKTLLALAATALSLLACTPTDVATRSAPAAPGLAVHATAWQIAGLTVLVPPSLSVSEADRLYPVADIVWRGDARGDRRAQVKAMVEAAARKAGPGRGTPALVGIEILRFHGLTERARRETGGSYTVTFRLTLNDPRTGATLARPRIVEANLGSGNARHAAEVARSGVTEKQLVIDFLAKTIRRELGQPA